MSNMVIATNVLALNSHRALKGVGNSISKSSEKLSSGYRINRAADDAAGLAISEKMRSQIRGLDQASRNSQDGISLIQTAEGALQETQDMLQRMRELTVQASNDTQTQSDRDKIALELDELTYEIDATAEKTEFNTKKLIDGSWQSSQIYLQTGANSKQGLSFNIEKMDSAALGVTKNDVSSNVRASGVSAAVALDIDGGIDISDMTATEAQEAIGTYTFGSGSKVELQSDGSLVVYGMTDDATGDTAKTTYSKSDWATATLTLTAEDGGTFVIDNGTLTVTAGTNKALDSSGMDAIDPGTNEDVKFGEATVNIAVASSAADYANADTDELKYTFGTDVTMLDADGKKVEFTAGKQYTAQTLIDKGVTQLVDKEGNTYDLDDTTGQFADASVKTIGFTANSNAAKKNVEDLELGSFGDAQGQEISKVTTSIDKALELVSSQRAKLGAYQNRLEHTIKNLDTSSENLSASESRIRDTDMAKEMMSMTKANVLQRAATAMLAQANQAPQNILQLLG